MWTCTRIGSCCRLLICAEEYIVRASGRQYSVGRTAPVNSERARLVTSFYYQSAIDQAAIKASVRLMPATMLYSGRSADGSHLLQSAEYLQKELPIRLAHRISGFRSLPFIVGCNPHIFAVHDLYIRAFNQITEFPMITDLNVDQKFSQLLTNLLDEHKNVMSMLAEGFRESKDHIRDDELVKTFLDKTLTSRLATRMLCEHHLALHQEMSDRIGIIVINFSPKALMEKNVEQVRKICIEKYGKAPEVRLNGHLSTSFSYIAQPLEFIFVEILKNAMRATVEKYSNFSQEQLPPIIVTISNNDVDFILSVTCQLVYFEPNVEISDMGGGIKHEVLDNIWNYGFTTTGQETSEKWSDHIVFERSYSTMTTDSFRGYGFGLPACRAYAEYLNGEVRLQTMQGLGTDVYIRLRHIDGKQESFRI